MDQNVILMVVVIVLVTLGFTLVVVHWGLKHEEKKLALQAGEGDVARLEQILAVTHAEMTKLRDRVNVLERLVTDDDRKLAGEIERLRAAEARG
jgi:hypothetical protein